MKVLYIGQYSAGTTSSMRGEYLREILQPQDFEVINTNIPIQQTNKIFRSFGWRYHLGPLVFAINKYIKNYLKDKDPFDIVWVDKGVFIDPLLIKDFRSKGCIVIHYTPDTAFTYNQSKLFYDAIPYYNHCITTKSFEKKDYLQYGAESVIFCTQGYDRNIHFPRIEFSKKEGVVFVGLFEPSREEIIAQLIEDKIEVKLAGQKWEKFAAKNHNVKNFTYLGKGVFGDDYAKLISSGYISLGLLSKKFPELHTTRTFEIPACGTLLATESNNELRSLFSDDEVIYFSDKKELSEKIIFYLNHPENMRETINKATIKLNLLQVDYFQIITQLIKQMSLK